MTFKELICRLQEEINKNPLIEGRDVFIRVKLHPSAKVQDQNAELVSVTASAELPTLNKPIKCEIIITD